MVIIGKPWMNGGQQHAENYRGQVGLDPKPGNRNYRPNQRRNLRPVNAKTDAADNRKRHTGLLPHVARQVHEEVHQCCADPQGQQYLPAAQAQCIEADGE